MEKKAIVQAVETAKKHGFTPNTVLSEKVKDIENPVYRVAVVGKFQVGKTFLVNQVFLNESPILIEGNGICTTSVTTEIVYGPTLRLEVFKWTDKIEKNEFVSSKILDNPSSEEIKALTVGENRVTIADETAMIKLSAPNDYLKNYIILDTPGIDDPDPEILQNTTYRVIPGSDVAILVVRPKQLDQIELEMLRNKLIKDGVSRFMVLVSYNAKSENMTKENRAKIIETIKAQLTNIGKENIPVEMFCLDESVDDILCKRDEILLSINSFLEKNALPGRMEHVAAHVLDFLNNGLLQLKTNQTANGKSQEEREKLKAKTMQQKAEMQNRCIALEKLIKQDIDDIRGDAKRKLTQKIKKVFLEFAQKIEQEDDLEKIKNILTYAANEDLRLKLGEAIADENEKIRQNIRLAVGNRVSDLQNVAVPWFDFLEEEFNIDGGFLAKIPSMLLEIGNIVIIDILLPGGLIMAIIGNMLQKIIPILKELTLKRLLITFLKNQVINAIEKEKPNVIENANQQLDEALNKVSNQIITFIREKFMVQTDIVLDGIDKETEKSSAELNTAITEITQAIENLK